MPPSSPAQAPVRSIALGSNLIGVAVQTAATSGLGLAIGVDEAADAAVAADGTVAADGVLAAGLPQPSSPTKPAQTSPADRSLLRTVCVLTRTLLSGGRSRVRGATPSTLDGRRLRTVCCRPGPPAAMLDWSGQDAADPPSASASAA